MLDVYMGSPGNCDLRAKKTEMKYGVSISSLPQIKRYVIAPWSSCNLTTNEAGQTATPVGVGGQELYLRLLEHLGRSSEAKDRKRKKNWDSKMLMIDRPTVWRTKRRVESRSALLKTEWGNLFCLKLGPISCKENSVVAKHVPCVS